MSIKNGLSPAVTALSLVLLINTHSLFIYIFSSITSIVSKYTLSLNKNHFFNPSLFGVVATYCWFDFGSFKIQYDQFMGIGYCSVQLCLLGFWTLYFAKRWLMPIAYYFVLTLGSFFHNFLNKEIDFLEIIGPELSASGILFAFFMMTDPVTSPSGKWNQIFFSSMCALISLFFTSFQILHANFISLFLINYICLLLRGFKKATFLKIQNRIGTGS